MATQPAHDYETILALAISVLEHPEPARPWPMVLDTLTAQLNGTSAIISEVRPPPGIAAVPEATPSGLSDLAPLLEKCVPEDPLIQHYVTTDDLTPHTTCDVVDLSRWRQTRSYSLARDLLAARSCVSVPFPATAGCHRGLTVTLPELSLTEQQMGYVRRLQPLLIALDRHIQHLKLWRSQIDGHDSGSTTRHDVIAQLGITPREITVLVLLAETHTAATIARRLGISLRTVHKHLENIYRKLDTTDRLATVQRARTLGLLPTGS